MKETITFGFQPEKDLEKKRRMRRIIELEKLGVKDDPQTAAFIVGPIDMVDSLISTGEIDTHKFFFEIVLSTSTMKDLPGKLGEDAQESLREKFDPLKAARKWATIKAQGFAFAKKLGLDPRDENHNDIVWGYSDGNLGSSDIEELKKIGHSEEEINEALYSSRSYKGVVLSVDQQAFQSSTMLPDFDWSEPYLAKVDPSHKISLELISGAEFLGKLEKSYLNALKKKLKM